MSEWVRLLLLNWAGAILSLSMAAVSCHRCEEDWWFPVLLAGLFAGVSLWVTEFMHDEPS